MNWRNWRKRIKISALFTSFCNVVIFKWAGGADFLFLVKLEYTYRINYTYWKCHLSYCANRLLYCVRLLLLTWIQAKFKYVGILIEFRATYHEASKTVGFMVGEWRRNTLRDFPKESNNWYSAITHISSLLQFPPHVPTRCFHCLSFLIPCNNLIFTAFRTEYPIGSERQETNWKGWASSQISTLFLIKKICLEFRRAGRLSKPFVDKMKMLNYVSSINWNSKTTRLSDHLIHCSYNARRSKRDSRDSGKSLKEHYKQGSSEWVLIRCRILVYCA